MSPKLKNYLFFPVSVLLISLYLFGLSFWRNRIYEYTVLPYYINSVTTQEEQEADISSKDKLNINTATKEDLMKIDKIGEKTAERILEKREKLGAFSAVEQLLEVDGIGEKTLEHLKKFIIAE